MEVRQDFAVLLICGAICGCLAGCRSKDPSVDLLEGELRWMEDQLYMIEDELALKCDELSRCRQTLCADCVASSPGTTEASEPASLFPLLNKRRQKPKTSRPTPGKSLDSRRRAPPATGDEGDELDDLSEPVIELPTLESPAESSGEEPAALPALDFDTGRYEPVTDQEVTHIVVSGHLDEGLRRNNPSYPEGILVIVQPRNTDGQFIDKSAPVSVVLLDSGTQGEEARLARWDLDAVETGKTMRATKTLPGMHLQLPWPDKVPKYTEDMRVFVRYTTESGEVVESDDWVSSKPPAAVAGHWMPIDRTETVPASHLADADDDGPATSQEAEWTTQPMTEERPSASSDIESSVNISERPQPPSWRPYR
jgi:hypothetical protein